MNAPRLFAVALCCVFSRGLAAQSTSATTTLTGAETDMRPVAGELTDPLDSTTAKVGDRVVIKVKAASRLADGTEIPRGSKLVARITGVQPAGSGNAQIALAFDHVELKKEQDLAIQGEIVALSSASSGDSNNASAPMGPSPSNGSAGRAAGDMYGSTPSITAPSQSANQAQTKAPSAVAEGGTIVAHSGDLVIRTTAMQGVLLANHEAGPRGSHPSSILLGPQHDIHLVPGTRLMVQLESAQTTTP